MTDAPTIRAGKARLDGLDLARFLAFVGMVIVNFQVVMSTETGAPDFLASPLGFFVGALEGRAAATFVVLAGIGLGLAGLKGADRTVAVTVRRAAFLLVLGLVNTLVFDADIIHYYAFYFFFGVFLLPLSNRQLFLAIVAVNIVFVVMMLTLNYDQGWNWDDLTYADFWTPAGFVRNLFFNGWHPVFPWIGFLLFGVMLARLKLGERSVQRGLVIGGAIALAIAEGISALLTPALSAIDPELASLSSTEPIPPMPLYTLAGIGAASLVIGVCLLIAERAARARVLRLVLPAGRQTLTLYIAHILIGMGIIEELGLLGDQPLSTALVAALIFCALATAYAFVWSKTFKRGPIEALMRRVAG